MLATQPSPNIATVTTAVDKSPPTPDSRRSLRRATYPPLLHHHQGHDHEDHEERDWLGDALGRMDNPRSDGGALQDAAALMAEDLKSLLGDWLPIDIDSRGRLIRRLAHTRWVHSADMLNRIRTGQWVRTVVPADFPVAPKTPRGKPGGDSMTAMLEGWAKDRGHNPAAKSVHRALYDRQQTMKRLAEFIGHRDAGRVTREEAIRYKQDAQDRGLTAATIRNDMSEMSAVWRWGVAHDLVTENPWTGLLPPKPKRAAKVVREFTNDEAAAILLAARLQQAS